MDTLSSKFFSFLKICVVTAIVLILVVVALSLLSGPIPGDATNLNMSILLTIVTATGVGILFSKINTGYKVISLICLAFITRLVWTLNIPSVPVSDFDTLYDAAESFLAGDKGVLRDYGYLARFPHLVPMMVYVMGMMKVFGPYHVFAIKSVALALSVLNVYLIYVLASYYTKKSSTRLFAMLFAVIFPPFITYCSTYCTETIGVTFFLLSMIVFHKAINAEKNKLWYFLLCGCILYLGDLFRAVTIILIIAFIMYTLIFTKGKKISGIAVFLSGYFLVAVTTSTILIATDVIEQPLWKGKEPVVATLMLKGSNFESKGAWNVDDAMFVEENLRSENLSELCFERIGKRLSEHSFVEVAGLYSVKFLSQWSVGDFSGTYWATHSTNIPYHFPLPYIFQLIYCGTLIFAVFTFKSKKDKSELALLYILLCGFGLAFTILETQGRYSYIISWVFILLASIGFENLNISKNTFQKLKEKLSKKKQNN